MCMGLDGLVGASSLMQQAYRHIHRASAHTYPVLITGETGTGKRSVARLIHSLGRGRKHNFASVGCAEETSNPDSRGLFTDASLAAGHFAGAGSLLVQDVSELSRASQGAFLRVIQKQLSAAKSIPPRFLCSTQVNLAARVKAGTFSEELYVLLNMSRIDLPPLRERKSDIPLLVDTFVEKYAGERSPVNFTRRWP